VGVLVVRDDGNAREVRLLARATRDVAAQPEGYPMSIGVAEPEDAIDERDAIAEVAIDLAAQVIFGVKRLGDEAERHGLAGRL
jgi:hypothetical protein